MIRDFDNNKNLETLSSLIAKNDGVGNSRTVYIRIGDCGICCNHHDYCDTTDSLRNATTLFDRSHRTDTMAP